MANLEGSIQVYSKDIAHGFMKARLTPFSLYYLIYYRLVRSSQKERKQKKKIKEPSEHAITARRRAQLVIFLVQYKTHSARRKTEFPPQQRAGW